MPRLLRSAAGRAVLHVVNRGNDRRRLFERPADYDAFLRIVAGAQGRTSMRVLGYVVMPNHWHLVVWPDSLGQLSQFMQRLTAAHAAVVRSMTHTLGHGHVYQGRYHATAVRTDRQLVRTLRYVEANPVRAGLVVRAEMWRWSSLDERLGTARIIEPPPVILPEADAWVMLVNHALEAGATPTKPRRPRSGMTAEWGTAR